MADMGTNSFDVFKTTIWEEVNVVRDGDGEARVAARSRLIARYQPALRAHLVLRKRLERHLADELLQGFVADKMLQQDLFSRANPQKGKLRSLLIRSLENYVRDHFRSRGKEKPAQLVEEHLPAGALTSVPVDFIDVAWARQVIEETVALVHDDCRQRNQDAIWQVFEQRLLRPLRANSLPTTYNELAGRLNFRSPRQAENALITAKRKFKRAFIKIVSGYLAEGEDIQQVIAEVIGILSVAENSGWQVVSSAWTEEVSNDMGLRTELDEMHPAHFARLVNLNHNDCLGNSEDPAEMLRHQLMMPLHNWISETCEPSPNLKSSVRAKTLGQLFGSADSPTAALALIKRDVKKKVSDEELPHDIALILYFASIAAAMVNHAERITASDDELLTYGFSKVLAFDWLDGQLRQLLTTALRRMAGTTEG